MRSEINQPLPCDHTCPPMRSFDVFLQSTSSWLLYAQLTLSAGSQEPYTTGTIISWTFLLSLVPFLQRPMRPSEGSPDAESRCHLKTAMYQRELNQMPYHGSPMGNIMSFWENKHGETVVLISNAANVLSECSRLRRKKGHGSELGFYMALYVILIASSLLPCDPGACSVFARLKTISCREPSKFKKVLLSRLYSWRVSFCFMMAPVSLFSALWSGPATK